MRCYLLPGLTSGIAIVAHNCAKASAPWQQAICVCSAESFPRVDDLPAACLGGGDDFDFDGGAFRQGSDLDGGAGGGVGFEVGAVKLVYGLEIDEVGQENGRIDDVYEIQSLCPEHGCDVFDHPPRVCINVAGNDFASLWFVLVVAGREGGRANGN